MKKLLLAFLFVSTGAHASGHSHILSVGVLGGGNIGMVPAAVFGIPYFGSGYGVTAGLKPIPWIEIAGSYKYNNYYVPGMSTITVFGTATQLMVDVRLRPSEQFGFYIGPTLGTQTFSAVGGLPLTATTATLSNGIIGGFVLGYDTRLADHFSIGFESGYIYLNPVPLTVTFKVWI